MITPDRKVRKLMEEYQKTGKLSTAALRADLDPKTARKYLDLMEHFGITPRTIQVSRNTYSVPSRLKGEKVKARVYVPLCSVCAIRVRDSSAIGAPGSSVLRHSLKVFDRSGAAYG